MDHEDGLDAPFRRAADFEDDEMSDVNDAASEPQLFAALIRASSATK